MKLKGHQMISFEGKTVLITGAASGIGKACAQKLRAAGASLALCDINIEALKSLESELGPGTGTLSLHALNIADDQSCSSAIHEAVQSHGLIDHLINAAGIYPEVLVKDMTNVEWLNLMRVNLDGTFYICRAIIPYLSDKSSLVTIASVAAHRGSYSHAHYSASKGAVISFGKSLALELAPKTRVNMVSPGVIATPMTKDVIEKKGSTLMEITPLGRFGMPEEVADGIVFLCSNMASFVTGATLHINGGLYLH